LIIYRLDDNVDQLIITPRDMEYVTIKNQVFRFYIDDGWTEGEVTLKRLESGESADHVYLGLPFNSIENFNNSF